MSLRPVRAKAHPGLAPTRALTHLTEACPLQALITCFTASLATRMKAGACYFLLPYL